jgi:diguanylate cyclase (GGDEF)-like protein
MTASRNGRAANATLLTAAAFNSAAVAAATAATPQLLLGDALAQLASLLEVPACSILVDSADERHCAAAVGVSPRDAQRANGHELPEGFRSRWSVPLALADGRQLGALVAFRRDRTPPDPQTLELASAYGSVIALGLDRQGHQRSLAARYQAVVVALTSALDTRDEYTGGHSTETSNLAERVAERMGVDESERELVSHVAVLHDVGKLGIPTHVLLKPGPLDSEERALMREHPVIGERILSRIPELSEVATAIRCEHERWDGAGYPDGVAGEEIPLASRIVFACDAWHAMTSDRPYRPAMAREIALRELRENAGTQFDPRVTRALLEILDDDEDTASLSAENSEETLSGELGALTHAVGAEDLFVFRRVTGGIYSHLGGVGRGAGWAGNIEVDSDEEHHLRSAIEAGRCVSIELESTGRIVGPYYGRSAVIVPCGDDALVVFGSPTASLAGACNESLVWTAARIKAMVVEVRPAKRLADELEVLEAVREVTTVNADTIEETLGMIAARARAALSAEYAAVAMLSSGEVDGVVAVSAGRWQPPLPDAAHRAFGALSRHPELLPLLSRDVADWSDAPPGFTRDDGVCSMIVLPIGRPAVAIMLVAHAGADDHRGFTDLCQRVSSAISDAAEPVVRRAIVQERLRAENARLFEQLRTDALTGVASRSAWDEALRGYREADGPLSVVIVDVDGLKRVNDEFGHAAGDDLLRRCGRALANSVGLADLVARIGGDEFGILLRYADEQQARAWCERLGRRLRRSSGSRLSWSLGFASVPPNGSVADAVDEADRRMYVHKQHRRAVRI